MRRNLPQPLKHGIEHESKAVQQYEKYLKHSGQPLKFFSSGVVANPAYPFLGCSQDGKVIDETEEDRNGILEIKCPPKHRNVTPKTACDGYSQFHLELKDDFPVLKTNHKYYYQVQGQIESQGISPATLLPTHFRGWSFNVCIEFFANILLNLEPFFFKHFAKYYKAQPVTSRGVNFEASEFKV